MLAYASESTGNTAEYVSGSWFAPLATAIRWVVLSVNTAISPSSIQEIGGRRKVRRTRPDVRPIAAVRSGRPEHTLVGADTAGAEKEARDIAQHRADGVQVHELLERISCCGAREIVCCDAEVQAPGIRDDDGHVTVDLTCRGQVQGHARSQREDIGGQ